ncbi:MAG TPA: VanW family protein [Acidimicrobiales bacterium]|nr:VanW family protein [Acidimicrobiales bacterium]
MHPRRRLVFVALGVAVLACGLVGTAMAINGHGKVARHVTLSGHSVAGLSRAELTARVKAIDTQLRKTTVQIDAPRHGFKITLDDLGARVDVAKTVKATMRVGRSGNPLGRLWSAVKAWVSERPASIQISIDEAKLRAAVAAHDPGPKTPSKEPSLTRTKGVFVAVNGQAGYGIDPTEVARLLPGAVADGAPIRLKVGRGRVPPRYTMADAEALARQANALGKLELKVSAGGETQTVSPTMLAGWIDALPTAEALLLGVNGPRAVTDLQKLFPDVGKPVAQTKYGISSSGAVVVTPGSEGTKCCDPDQVSTLLTAAIRRPPAKPITLPLKITEPDITQADINAFGIKEVIGTFTTHHVCCQPRVQNIHHIADLVRGYVMKPHTRLSINTLIGPRTLAKGFVVDHVIEDGVFSEAVGGGISQFATTLWNAAFFGGLDLISHQSHSIYISRYPYGRDATLNYPQPDLVIGNSTPYGVLVWPTYTGTSLTVTLYSTKYAIAEQTNQTQGKRGVCTDVVTERTRTYPDGTKKVDKIHAVYRPGEGQNCDGTVSATTTTSPPKATTTTKPASPSTTSP